MEKSVNRWKLARILSGIITLFLFLQALLFGVVSASGMVRVGGGWSDIVIGQGMVFVLCSVGTGLWGYWLAGWIIRKMSEADERIHAFDEIGSALEEQPSGRGDYLFNDRPDTFTLLLQQYEDRQRQTLRELKSTNGFLHSIIEHSSDAICVLGLNGRIKRVNPAFEMLYGYSSAEVLESPLPVIFPGRLREEPLELIRRVQEGEPVNGYETNCRTKGGQEIHVSLTLSPILEETGRITALAAISRNITERKATEIMMRQSEKLSIVGQLAAGVAHEIRNPLTTLRGFVQLQKLRKNGNPDHLELMIEELDRINFIISEFIVLSKPHLNQFVFKDLMALLSELSRLLESQANLNNIILETRLDPELPKIRCEENQLKQVFLNVIKNSMEAMPDGGIVLMEARKLDADRVIIRITDHGGGIPEDMLPRLGEPFLSGKENGTGLGIMVSRQIVANHKGQLVVRSELGKGTSVDIVLPVDFKKLEPDFVHA